MFSRLRADLMQGAERVGMGGGGANCSFGAVRVTYVHDTGWYVHDMAYNERGVVWSMVWLVLLWVCDCCLVVRVLCCHALCVFGATGVIVVC